MKKLQTIRCQSCGSSDVANSGKGIGKCSHCGSTMILPRQDEEIIALLNAAYVYRENFNYDLAIKSYQFVLEKDSNELSAYEGILLSEYGIEYVKDSYTGKLIPTCHRAHFKSILEDDYYKTLYTLASDEQKAVIENKAKEIDKLQKAIERQLKNEQEYDVFISYKATDSKGEKSEDSIIARNIYEELIKKNYRVFLAEKSLEDRLGSEYEPIIFKALHTSKIFILVGTSKQNIESSWVRNEWSRFVDRIKTDKDLPTGCFIPVFKDMSPYDMPKVNNTFVQGVDAGKLGYAITVADGVSKLLKPEKEQKVISAFDDIDNFAEFDRIRKHRTAELKKKNWEQLKASKGFKKWGIMAFLYSPWLLGILAIIFGSLVGSRFIKNPEFPIYMIILVALLTMSIVTVCFQARRYGLKPILHVVIPFGSLAMSLTIYLLGVLVFPLNTLGEAAIHCGSAFEKYRSGIIYSDEYGHLDIFDLTFGYKRYVKEIDGKTTLILPTYFVGQKVSGADILIPDEIEALVMPKYYDPDQTRCIITDQSKLKEAYYYEMTGHSHIYRTTNPKQKECLDLTRELKVYYQKGTISDVLPRHTYIQKDNMSFYKGL